MSVKQLDVATSSSAFGDGELLNRLRALARRLGTDTLTAGDLVRHGAISPNVYARRFGSWRHALRRAGLRLARHGRWSDGEIFDEIEQLWSLLGHEPTGGDFRELASISYGAVTRRFGRFEEALRAFAGHAREKAERRERALRGRCRGLWPAEHTSGARPRYGRYIHFRGMVHAPLNEQGVLYLFARVADELGFVVEAIRPSFPDCEAKRVVSSTGALVRQEIEFELKSSNYQKHGHPLDWDGVIVCWEHDWASCPPSIEVIELKSVLAALR